MLAAMGIQALSEDLDHVTLYDNNPEVLKHAYENFSRHCEKHLTITTVIADHNKNHGFDLTADIVMANPDFETEHLLKVISNMETFSRQDSLKLAIVPSHLYEDVRNLIFSTNRIAKDIFPELKI
jgi:16S rRNA G966 N2-methylase RsmD